MLWAFLFIAMITIAVMATNRPHSNQSDSTWPLESCRPLSEIEQKLYWRLVSALPDHVVLSQVQLSRIMKVKRVQNERSWRNRIDRKSADFVVCNRDFTIAAVIELDDSTHARADRKKADADKDAALKSARIQVIRWTVKALPNADDIGKMFSTAAATAEARPASAVNR